MNRKSLSIHAAVAVAIAITAMVIAVAPPATRAATADDTLERPRDVRELVFLSSGHGMAYGPAAEKAKQAGGGSPPFTNVFVTPDAYRSFMQTGHWPDGTTFFMEVRAGITNTANGISGSSQGPLIALEAEKKDSRLYPDGGAAYFNFGSGGAEPRGRLLPASAGCYACHSRHGAVDATFTQFYPEQFAVAKKMGTVRKDYDPDLK